MQTISDGGIDACGAACKITGRLYGSAKRMRRMNEDSVSVGAGFFGIGHTIVLGGTSAMVETGIAGASNNTPRITCDPGRNLTGGLGGVHFMRTITTVYRPKCIDPIGCYGCPRTF